VPGDFLLVCCAYAGGQPLTRVWMKMFGLQWIPAVAGMTKVFVFGFFCVACSFLIAEPGGESQALG